MIISGFPGIGKSTLAGIDQNILDLDSAGFSWCPGDKASDSRVQQLIDSHSSCDKNQTKRERNPNATSDYTNAILTAMLSNQYKYIFVSTHENTRKWLFENKIPFILVYPAKDRKEEWKENLFRRGTTGLANFLYNNWDNGINLIGGLESDEYASKKIVLQYPKFLADYKDQLSFPKIKF